MKNQKHWKKKAMLGLITLATICTLSGCDFEKAPVENYGTTINQYDSNDIYNGLTKTQILDVPGEDFKLIIDYNIDLREQRQWRITSDKLLYFTVYTEGLDPNSKLYIDNIHMDTSIKSIRAAMDGIKQDTMDDKIHNSLMYGFPISDTIKLHGINAIEGANQDFISGSFCGYKGFESGNIQEKRYTERDYLQTFGVYGNKIQAVYDLLLQKSPHEHPRNISVASELLILVDNQYIDDDVYEKIYKKVK